MRELEASLRSLRGAVREYGALSRGEAGGRMRSTKPAPGGAHPDASGTAIGGVEAVRARLWERIAALLRAMAGKARGAQRR